MKPWLSVIVPVHDGARFLGTTLASAAAERPDGVEFLLYDSGDDAGAARRIAEGFTDRLDIRWQSTPDIKPWTAKTNLGVREARARHVCMLHQDDLWLPGHLRAIRASITADPAAVLSIAPSRFVSASGKGMGQWRLPFRPGRVESADFAAMLIVQNSIAIPSPVIAREAWLACGGMDDTLWYTADWDLYLRLAQQGHVQVRAVVTTAFRIHGSSLTMTGSRNADAFRDQLESVLDRHLSGLPSAMRGRAERLARASIEMNCLLAAAASGRSGGLRNAVRAMVRLGLTRIPAYLRQSRLVDRLVPRLRLSLSGGM